MNNAVEYVIVDGKVVKKQCAISEAIEKIQVDGVEVPITDKTVDIDLSGKVDVVEGKGLSTNDFTTLEKDKLAAIQTPMQIQGRVDSVEDLPTTNVKKGDTYLVGVEDCEDFEEYVCVDDTDIKWECIGRAGGVIPDWNQNNTEANDYIKNRIAYSEQGTTIVFNDVFSVNVDIEEEGITESIYNGFVNETETSYIDSLTAGEQYKVVINGTSYDVTCVDCVNIINDMAAEIGEAPLYDKESGEACYVLCNNNNSLSEFIKIAYNGIFDESSVDITKINNKDFAFFLDKGTIDDEDWATLSFSISSDTAITSCVITVKEGQEVEAEIVHKLDLKYKPNSDWEQNDSTKGDYIKNRIAYSEQGTTTVFNDVFDYSSYVIVFDNDLYGIVCNDCSEYDNALVFGEEYSVSINGVSYNLTCVDVLDDAIERMEEISKEEGEEFSYEKSDGEYIKMLSNNSNLAIDFLSTNGNIDVSKLNDGDFCVLIQSLMYDDEIEKHMVVFCYSETVLPTCSVSVKKSSVVEAEIVHKLDLKYKPNSDWEQNDSTKGDYIKNRSHYDLGEKIGTVTYHIQNHPEELYGMEVKSSTTSSGEPIKTYLSEIVLPDFDLTEFYDFQNGDTGVFEVTINGKTFNEEFICQKEDDDYYYLITTNYMVSSSTVFDTNHSMVAELLVYNGFLYELFIWVREDDWNYDETIDVTIPVFDVKVSKIVRDIKKLDVKYLPDGGFGYIGKDEEVFTGEKQQKTVTVQFEDNDDNEDEVINLDILYNNEIFDVNKLIGKKIEIYYRNSTEPSASVELSNSILHGEASYEYNQDGVYVYELLLYDNDFPNIIIFNNAAKDNLPEDAPFSDVVNQLSEPGTYFITKISNEVSSYSIIIDGVGYGQEKIHQIYEKFIPSDIARLSDAFAKQYVVQSVITSDEYFTDNNKLVLNPLDFSYSSSGTNPHSALLGNFECSFYKNDDICNQAYPHHWSVRISDKKYAMVTGATTIGIYTLDIDTKELSEVETISVDEEKITNIWGIAYADEDDTLLVTGVGTHCLLITDLGTEKEETYLEVSSTSTSFMHMDIKNKDFFILGCSGVGIMIYKDGEFLYKWCWKVYETRIINDSIFLCVASYNDGFCSNYNVGISRSDDYGQTWTRLYQTYGKYERWSGVDYDSKNQIYIITDYRHDSVLFFDTDNNLLAEQSLSDGGYSLRCLDVENSIYISTNDRTQILKLVVNDGVPSFKRVMLEYYSYTNRGRFFDVFEEDDNVYLLRYEIKGISQYSYDVLMFDVNSDDYNMNMELSDMISYDVYDSVLYIEEHSSSSYVYLLKKTSVNTWSAINCFNYKKALGRNYFSNFYVIESNKIYYQIAANDYDDEYYIYPDILVEYHDTSMKINIDNGAGTYSIQQIGQNASATGRGSSAFGSNTTAKSSNQHVFGKYNVSDEDNTYVELVGNGASGSLSNARTLDWVGNEVLSGTLTTSNVKTRTSSTAITLTTAASTYTFTEEPDKKIYKVILNDDGVIVLPTVSSDTSITFMLKVTQGTAGAKSLIINDADGNAAVNLNEFDFNIGEPEQRCWVTLLWDGEDWCYTVTDYIDKKTV